MSAPHATDKAQWAGLLRSAPGTTSQTFWVVLAGEAYECRHRVVLKMPSEDLRALSRAEVDALAIALVPRKGVPA